MFHFIFIPLTEDNNAHFEAYLPVRQQFLWVNSTGKSFSTICRKYATDIFFQALVQVLQVQIILLSAVLAYSLIKYIRYILNPLFLRTCSWELWYDVLVESISTICTCTRYLTTVLAGTFTMEHFYLVWALVQVKLLKNQWH